MRIPEIQEKLIEKALHYNDQDLMRLALELSRRKPISKAPPSSAPMTPKLRWQIQVYARVMPPTLTQMDIAKVFNVSQGRVSEALHGKRT